MRTQFTNSAYLKNALERVLYARLASYIDENLKTLLQWHCNAHFNASNDNADRNPNTIAKLLLNADDHKGFLLPTELRTKELSILDVWVRERAFFMATVTRAEVLDRFRSRIGQIASGELSVQQARSLLREELDELRYEPSSGQEGTIKDLRTRERMNVALETNLLQVQGYGRWSRQQQTLDAFPAQRFVRVRMSKVPRGDWQDRFAQAVASTNSAGADIHSMTALVNHPCWTQLSVFGTPYPPFDFNSGMGLEPVDRQEAEDLGLLPDDNSVAEMMQPHDRGLNEGLESSPRIKDERLKTAIRETMQGLAKWEGNVLEFTDPNGTKPYSAEELVELWKEPLPDTFSKLPGKGLMQKQALIDWANDHEDFEKKYKNQYTDRWDDITRLHGRLKPADEVPSLYRGLKKSSEDVEGFLAGIKKNGYGVRDAYPVESWTKSEKSALHYARPHSRNFSVILEIENPNPAAFKDISPFIRELKHQNQLQKDTNPPITTESEWLFARGTKLKVRSISRDDEKRIIRINLQSERGTL